MKNGENNLSITSLFKETPSPYVDSLTSILAEKNSVISEKESVIAEQKKSMVEKDFHINKLENEIRWFKEQMKLSRHPQFGRSSEQSSALQIEIIFNDEVTPETESDETPEAQEAESEQITSKPRKKKSCGRKLDTSRLPRERRIHDLMEEEKTCPCGCRMEKISEETSEQIEHIPEQLKVIEHVRYTYACRPCEAIKTATKAESPIPKSMAAASLLTDVIIKKYDHHLPLYRQSQILTQQGFAIPDNTLGNWVMQSAEALLPLGEALWEQLNHIHRLQCDETPVKILKPDKEGYLWVYHSTEPGNRFIHFEFTLSRSGDHPKRRLKNYHGFFQTDGYSGYNAQRAQAGIINIGCWDHARRKFVDVIKINGNNKSGKAGEMLHLISKLYEVEEAIRGKTVEERRAERQEKAKPLLALIHSKLCNIHAIKQSALGKAVTYALNQWEYLSRYVEYGEVEISNCWTENQIRPFALGRKNWLFVGNETSANKSALLYSLIQSCKLNNIHPRRYLIYVLNQAHHMRRKEIDPVTLLPQFINKELLA